MISSNERKLPKKAKTSNGQEWRVFDVSCFNKLLKSFTPFLGHLSRNQSIQYVLMDNQEPITFILLQDYFNDELHVGYPLVLPNLSIKAQNKFLNEIYNYIKNYRSKKEIRLYVPEAHKDSIDFFIKNGLVIKSELLRHEFDVLALSTFSFPEKSFKCRLANRADLKLVIDLIKSDIQFKGLLSKIHHIGEYIERIVLEPSRTLLIFEHKKLIGAAMPVLDEEDNIVLEFYAIRSGNEVAWKQLLVNLAKLCVSHGWNKKLTVFMNSFHHRVFPVIVDDLRVNSSVEGFFFGLSNNNFS
ncbi:MAG: hypothetical protein ACFE8U_06405 [Candidatus Hermodarchaeota archaeon]